MKRIQVFKIVYSRTTIKMTQIISIEGNIGSGKSTFLSYLKEYYKDSEVIFLREPVDEWEKIREKETGETMLEKFYADQPRYAFSFQIMAFISRLSLLREIVKTNPYATIITERCLHTDKLVFAKMLYDMGNIEDVNYQIYCQIYDEFAKDYPVQHIIYIRADPEICHERIQLRSRQGESSISLEYLTQCAKYHDDMIVSLDKSRTNIHILDGNVNIHKMGIPSINAQLIHDIIGDRHRRRGRDQYISC